MRRRTGLAVGIVVVTKRLQPRQQQAYVLLDQRALPRHALDHRHEQGLPGQLVRQPDRIQAQSRQALPELVVQFARQSGALVLLQRQHLLAEQAPLCLRGIERATQVAQG